MLRRKSAQSVALGIEVRNKDEAPLRLMLEPWGRELVVPAAGIASLEFEGPAKANIEIHVGPNTLILYGWAGSFLEGPDNVSR